MAKFVLNNTAFFNLFSFLLNLKTLKFNSSGKAEILKM